MKDTASHSDSKAFLLRRNLNKEGFLVLANSVPNVNNLNTGTCPHGLPPGACPVCSTGAGSMRQSDRNRNIGEMTYHECAMIGNMMKARELAQKNHEANLEHRAENLEAFQKNLEKLSANMLEFAKQISNFIPLKPIAFVIKNIAVPVVNFVRNIPKLVSNFKFEIMDKLSAIFGEAKAFVDKKVSEMVSVIKNFILKVFKKNNSDDEDTKIDDDKKIFNLKTILQKIIRKKKKKHEHDTENL